MIKAGNFSLDKVNNNLVARCDVAGPGLPNSLWFAAETDDESALEIDEPNWSAVALLYTAMGLGQDLEINAKISPRLLYNLNHDVQHLFQAFNPNLSKIEIVADAGEPKTYGSDVKRHSITGFSGGVDSSATYVLYSGKDVPKSMRISALSIYDVGALGRTPKNPSFEHLQPHYNNLKKFCDKREIEAFGISSNLRQIFRPVRKNNPNIGFLSATISLRNIAATLAMQNRVKNYYPSGARGYSDVGVSNVESCELFEPITDALLSTESLFCQTGAAGLDRSEKIKLLSSVDFARTELNVCVGDAEQRKSSKFLNCGKCWKCIDTQFEADGMGVLKEFADVFDTRAFRETRDELLDSLIESNVSFEHEFRKKLIGIANLYETNRQVAPEKLLEITKQLNKGEAIPRSSTSKQGTSALKRFLAKIR